MQMTVDDQTDVAFIDSGSIQLGHKTPSFVGIEQLNVLVSEADAGVDHNDAVRVADRKGMDRKGLKRGVFRMEFGHRKDASQIKRNDVDVSEGGSMAFCQQQ